MTPVLRGDRNQCQGCKRYFNSTAAFDKHRAGEHGRNRCCLPVAEMQAKGMVLRDDGFWRGSAMPDAMTYPPAGTAPLLDEPSEPELAQQVADDKQEAITDARVAAIGEQR